MKTVICFDTDDQRGMNDARKIMEHLVKEYLDNRSPHAGQTVKFGKINFIKMLRKFAKENQNHLQEINDFDPGSLRNAKQFADRIFDEQRELRFK